MLIYYIWKNVEKYSFITFDLYSTYQALIVCQEMWVMLKIQWTVVHRSSLPSSNSLERQNPLQAIARTVTVYHSKKIQMKVRQEKRHLGQISRKFQIWSFRYPLLWSHGQHNFSRINVQWYTQSIASQRGSSEPGCPEFLLGLHHIGTRVVDLSLQPLQG